MLYHTLDRHKSFKHQGLSIRAFTVAMSIPRIIQTSSLHVAVLYKFVFALINDRRDSHHCHNIIVSVELITLLRDLCDHLCVHTLTE